MIEGWSGGSDLSCRTTQVEDRRGDGDVVGGLDLVQGSKTSLPSLSNWLPVSPAANSDCSRARPSVLSSAKAFHHCNPTYQE